MESFKHTKLMLNPVNANITKWSNTLKQFVASLPTNCLSVFDHFVGLALKRLSIDLLKMSVCSFESKLHLTIGKLRLKSLKEGLLDNRFVFRIIFC